VEQSSAGGGREVRAGLVWRRPHVGIMLRHMWLAATGGNRLGRLHRAVSIVTGEMVGVRDWVTRFLG
jgi:hypothetical protein